MKATTIHNPLKSKHIVPSCVIDGYLMITKTEAAVVKESLTGQGSRRFQRIVRERFDENRRIADVRQADAEEIAELARIEKQLEQKKDKR